MYALSEQQIEYILSDIRRNGVEIEDLQLNLLDHICCIIEQNLEDDDDFEDFYKKTIQEFYKNNLWEIEEETIILLTFKHYYAMKKSMIICGTTAVVFLLAGAFFKIMHWPGANPALLLALALLSFIFLPLLFILKTREAENTRDKVVTGLAVIVGILLSMSTLFKLFHWPGASILWILTSAYSIFVFIPVYFFTGIKKAETKINTIVTTIILVGATGMLFSLTSLKPSLVSEVTAFDSEINLIHLTQDLKLANKYAYTQLQNDSSYSKKTELNYVHRSCKELYDRIDSIKQLLCKDFRGDFNYAEHTDSSGWKSYTISPDWERPTNILFGPHDHNATLLTNRLTELENHDNHQEFMAVWDKKVPSPILERIKSDLDNLTSYAEKHFKPFILPTVTQDTFTPKGRKTFANSWEMRNFYHASLTVVLRNLTEAQMTACMIENYVLLKKQ